MAAQFGQAEGRPFMERHFEKDINELKDRLLWMGSLAERSVHQAVHAVLESDDALANRVLEEEDAINELQLEIDDRLYGWRLNEQCRQKLDEGRAKRQSSAEASQSEQQVLRHELPKQAQPPCSQGETDGDFLIPRRAARQQQVGDIHGTQGDEQ